MSMRAAGLASIHQPSLAPRISNHSKQPHTMSIATCVRDPSSASMCPRCHSTQDPPPSLPMPSKDTGPHNIGAHRIYQIDPRRVSFARFPTVSLISKNSASKKVATYFFQNREAPDCIKMMHMAAFINFIHGTRFSKLQFTGHIRWT
jgi:hypothetical protein